MEEQPATSRPQVDNSVSESSSESELEEQLEVEEMRKLTAVSTVSSQSQLTAPQRPREQAEHRPSRGWSLSQELQIQGPPPPRGWSAPNKGC